MSDAVTDYPLRLLPSPSFPFFLLPPVVSDRASLISFPDPVCNPNCSGYTEPDLCTVPWAWWGRAAAAKQRRRRAASERSSYFTILLSFVTTVTWLRWLAGKHP